MAKAPFTRVRINYYTDITLHSSTLRLHETGGTGRIFERQVWDLLFFRSQICTLGRSKILPIPPVPCKGRVEPSKFLSVQKVVRTRVTGDSVQVWDLLFQVLKVLANEDTLLRTHCCGHVVADTNVSPFARARNICCGHNFVSGTQKMFLILFKTILCPQQMFPSVRAQGNVMSNNVSATMFPRLPPP